MLISPSDRIEVVLVAGYSLSAGVAAALIVGHTTTRALTRLTSVARRLGENQLDARVGELRASPELRQVGTALDLAAQRIADLIETERRTEAARRDLMTSISHDLRTPLANLRAMVEAIDDGVVDDPGIVREYSAQMLRLDPDAGGDGGGSLRPLAGGCSRVPQRRAVDCRGRRRPPRGGAVRSRCPGQVDRRAHRSDVGRGARCSAKLARVLDSLVDNAVRYTPTGGSVTVTATDRLRRARAEVQDSGGAHGRAARPRVRAVLEGRRLALDERLRPRTDARAAHHPRTRGRDPCSQRAGRWLAVSCGDPRPPSRRGMNPDP